MYWMNGDEDGMLTCETHTSECEITCENGTDIVILVLSGLFKELF